MSVRIPGRPYWTLAMDMASLSLVFLKEYLDLAAAGGSLDTSDYVARICGRQRSLSTFPDGSVQFDLQAEEASRAFDSLATPAAFGTATCTAAAFARKSVSENHVTVLVVPASYFDLLGTEGLVIGRSRKTRRNITRVVPANWSRSSLPSTSTDEGADHRVLGSDTRLGRECDQPGYSERVRRQFSARESNTRG